MLLQKKLPQTLWLKATQIYYLIVLKVRSLKWVSLCSNPGVNSAVFFPEVLWENLFCCLFQLVEPTLIPLPLAPSLFHVILIKYRAHHWTKEPLPNALPPWPSHKTRKLAASSCPLPWHYQESRSCRWNPEPWYQLEILTLNQSDQQSLLVWYWGVFQTEPRPFGVKTEIVLRKPGPQPPSLSPQKHPPAPEIRGIFPMTISIGQGIRKPWLCGLNIHGPVRISTNLSFPKCTQWQNKLFEEIITKFSFNSKMLCYFYLSIFGELLLSSFEGGYSAGAILFFCDQIPDWPRTE